MSRGWLIFLAVFAVLVVLAWLQSTGKLARIVADLRRAPSSPPKESVSRAYDRVPS